MQKHRRRKKRKRVKLVSRRASIIHRTLYYRSELASSIYHSMRVRALCSVRSQTGETHSDLHMTRIASSRAALIINARERELTTSLYIRECAHACSIAREGEGERVKRENIAERVERKSCNAKREREGGEHAREQIKSIFN